MLQLHASAVAPSRAAVAPRRTARAAPCLRARAPLRRVAAFAAKKKAVPEPEPEAAELSGPAQAVVYAGAVLLPVTLWSEYTLFSTGAGLQGDVLGGIEGVSYLVLLAVLGLSIQKKTSTGVGLEGTLPGACHAAPRSAPQTRCATPLRSRAPRPLRFARRCGRHRLPGGSWRHRRRRLQRAEVNAGRRSERRGCALPAACCQRTHRVGYTRAAMHVHHALLVTKPSQATLRSPLAHVASASSAPVSLARLLLPFASPWRSARVPTS